MIRYVNTKEELKRAIKEKSERIIIVNDILANQVKIAKNSSKKILISLICSIVSVIVTGFLSLTKIGWEIKTLSILTFVGVFLASPAIVLSVIFFGIFNFYSIYTGYDLEIDSERENKFSEVEIKAKGKFILKLKE